MHETAERLLRASEELLRERGQAAISLRDITDRAGANVAAVSYHFRSKDALLAETFALALREVTERQRERLEALPEDASLRDVVRVWLRPALEPYAYEARELALWELIARGTREAAPGLVPHMSGAQAATQNALVPVLARRLPALSEEELLLRHAATLAAMSALSSGHLTSALGVVMDADATEMLLDWVVAGLSGPGRPGEA